MDEPVSADVRAEPLQHAAGARVWAQIAGVWRPAQVLEASAFGVLVRHLLSGRGTGVETVSWRQLAAEVRTEVEPRVDGSQVSAAALVG